MHKKTIFVLAFIFVSGLLGSKVFAESAIDPDTFIDFLNKGYSDGISILNNVKMSFEMKEERDPDWLRKHSMSPDSKPPHYEMEYLRHGNKEKCSVGIQADLFPDGYNGLTVFDGYDLLSFISTKGLDDTETQRGRANLDKIPDFQGLRLEMKRETPYKLLGQMDSFMLEEALSMPDAVVSSEMENVGDFSCYRVDVVTEINRREYNLSYWLCPERSFLPAKWEIKEKDGTLVRSTKVTEFINLEEDRWFPKQVVEESFYTSESGETLFSGRDTFTTRSVEIDPVFSVDEFSTSPDVLPVGTLLQDHITGLEYVIGEGPVSDERIQAIIAKTLDDFIDIDMTINPDKPDGTIAASEEVATVPLFTDTGFSGPTTITEHGGNKKGLAITGVVVAAIIALVGFYMLRRRRSNKLLLIFLLLGLISSVQPAMANEKLENWQSCCGASCMQTVGGLLGIEIKLADARKLVKPNSYGETSLAEIADAAENLGLHSVGLRVSSSKLKELSVPVIAHMPPNHFVVLLGLGEDGVGIIDPPRYLRKITNEELAKQEYWNIVAISKKQISGIRSTPSGIVGGNKHSLTQQGKTETFGNLRFYDTLWYFGGLKPRSEKGHKFLFKNIGKKTVTISKVQPSCSCVEIKGFSPEIAPNQEGSIDVVFDSTGMAGYATKKITGVIKDSSGEKSVFFLTVTGEISRRGELVLKPARIEFSDMVKGSSYTKTVKLSRIGNGDLNIKQINSDTPSVDAKVLNGMNPGAKEAQIEIQVKASDEIGPMERMVVLETNNLDYPTITLPIQGNVISHIKVEPAEVFLGLLFDARGLKKTITISSRTNTPFEIKSVRSSVDNLLATVHPSNEAKSVWEIVMTNIAGFQVGLLNGRILVETNDPDLAKIEIPFTGYVREK